MNVEDVSGGETSPDVELETFRRAVESTGHAIYWTDTEGTIEYVNEAFENQTGYTAAEAVGQNASLLQSGIHPDSFYEQVWETILNGETWEGEIVNQRKDGEQYIVKQTIAPITDEEGTIIRFVAINEEITDLHEYQEQLAADRDRLGSLINAVPAPLVLVQFTDQKPLVKRVNSAFEDVFGISGNNLVGDSLDSHIVSEPNRGEAQQINATLREGEPVRQEVTREVADGTKRTFVLEATPLPDGAGQADEVLATYIDITERKRAENKQQLLTEISQSIGSAETFRDGLERTLRTICTYTEWTYGEVWQPAADSEQLEYVVGYTSDSSCDSFLRASRDVTFSVGDGLPGRVYDSQSPEWIPDVSRTDSDVFHRSDLAAAADLHAAVGVPLTSGDSVVAVILFFLSEPRTSDAERVAEISEIADNLGGLVARKAAEQMVKRRNERLEEFARVLGHDLRNPRNVAMSRLELVRDEYDTPHVEAIAGAHDRLQELIDDMMALARQGRAVDEMETVAVGDCATRCWQAIDGCAAELRLETTRTIRGDESRIRQLLENLFRNAIDHGPADVTITVGDLDNGFFVADTGPGIPTEQRQDIFEVGYTTHESGTGFGLPIVNEIAEAHGWTVTVTESQQGGARFEITGVAFVDE